MRTRALTVLLALILTGCVHVAETPPVPSAGHPSPRSSEVAGPPRLVVVSSVSSAAPVVQPRPPLRPYIVDHPIRSAIGQPVRVVHGSGLPTSSGDARAGHERTGVASWFCGHGSPCTRGYPDGLYAAAGPALRVGDWRGRSVLVSAGGRRVRVVLSDWCACPSRLIDLYSDAFSRLAPLSQGVVKVMVSW